MRLFCTDLDNTLIYSYKRELGAGKVNVERYEGREVSFVSARTAELLQEWTKAAARERELLFVPVTTRTTEQYERIRLGIGTPAYALTCNGGVLLAQGKEVDSWYRESLTDIEEAQGELEQAMRLLEQERRRNFDLRWIRRLFVFTKCEQAQEVADGLCERLDTDIVDVFCNGTKLYVVPKRLSKGTAVRRLRAFLGAKQLIAAGDSLFDVSMLREADLAIAPQSLYETADLPADTVVIPEQVLFSEGLLAHLLGA